MADVANSAATLLSNDWNSANTGGVTPKIDAIFDYKRLHFTKTAQNDGDWVLTYELVASQLPSGINTTHVNTEEPVVVDIRTMVSRAHLILLRDEVKRIFGANYVEPFSGATAYTEPELELQQDFSDRTKGLFRYVLNYRLKRFHTSRTSP